MTSHETEPVESDIEWANRALSPIVGETLSQFTMWGFGLHLDFGRGYQITVEAPLAVTVDGGRWQGDPATGGTAAALLKIVHTEITSATVAADGGLRVTTDHAVIEVRPREDFESWQLNGPGNLLVVCTPGGDNRLLSRQWRVRALIR